MTESEKVRIQKYLSQSGVCSRRKAEEFIEKGYIYVNGEQVQELGMKIHPEKDTVTLNKEAKKKLSNLDYIAFNKPKGIVTHSPQEGEQCIQDILPEQYQNLAPIGRLDKESCGLILLSNDGVFAKHCLEHENPHKRVYDIKISRPLTDEDILELEEGVMLHSEMTQPCTIKRLYPYRYQITLFEGKNRQIRRMIQKVGSVVIFLKRIQFGNYRLGDLDIGDCAVIKPTDVL